MDGIEHFCVHCCTTRWFRFVREVNGWRRYEVYECSVCGSVIEFAVA